jgi:hypothetical protein
MNNKKHINSKRKGNSNELYVANLLSERFGKTFKRVPASGAHGTNLANTDLRQDAIEILSGDIICPADFRFSIEVKSRVSFNFWDLLNKEDTEVDDWIRQAEREAVASKKEFLLIVRVNNRKPFVIVKDLSPNIVPGVIYKNYDIMRMDYFLEFENTFFFK